MAVESFQMDDDFLESESFHRRYRCCSLWNFPPRSDWERIPRSEVVERRGGLGSWWRKRIEDLKAVMKWPDWMQFIRRGSAKALSDRSKTNKFGYDPISYAMNFDEGAGEIVKPNDGLEPKILGYAAIYVDQKVTSG